jgi:hypothetical protein
VDLCDCRAQRVDVSTVDLVVAGYTSAGGDSRCNPPSGRDIDVEDGYGGAGLG